MVGRRLQGRTVIFFWRVVGAGLVSNIFYVHPENWGNDPI